MATRTYDDAINLLNTLQTPYAVLKKNWDAGIKLDQKGNILMRKCLSQIGYTQQDLAKLNIVHVAGTKGKGSTCAYVDSMLSQYRTSHDVPKKVGLFTSPHLIAVRERIRINSAPISALLFAKYFFEVWDRLEASSTTENPVEKPVYFRYLTLMSYHVFIQENTDVAIYEVGVGGEYDSTNICDAPAVTGISTLGIDHTFTLGDTIDKIAWNKAGIQKKGVPSFTVTQLPEAMEVLESRAKERDVQFLKVVKPDQRLIGVKIKPDAEFQRGNASLALALTETVLQRIDPSFKPSDTSLTAEFVHGLEHVVWRGRCETKVDGDITWYLDGAHTADSIIVAAKWFSDECLKQIGPRILIFNQQGHREAVDLLEGLYRAIKSHSQISFDHVIFCPTVPLQNSVRKDQVNLSTDASAVADLKMQKVFAEKWKSLDTLSRSKIAVLPSVEDAYEYVKELSVKARERGRSPAVHAFTTGSVHLIGRVLSVLEDVDAL